MIHKAEIIQKDQNPKRTNQVKKKEKLLSYKKPKTLNTIASDNGARKAIEKLENSLKLRNTLKFHPKIWAKLSQKS